MAVSLFSSVYSSVQAVVEVPPESEGCQVCKHSLWWRLLGPALLPVLLKTGLVGRYLSFSHFRRTRQFPRRYIINGRGLSSYRSKSNMTNIRPGRRLSIVGGRGSLPPRYIVDWIGLSSHRSDSEMTTFVPSAAWTIFVERVDRNRSPRLP